MKTSGSVLTPAASARRVVEAAHAADLDPLFLRHRLHGKATDPQQRHPGHPEPASRTADVAEPQNAQMAPDDDDVAADKRAMDQAQGLSAIARGYGINEGAPRDLVPGF